MKFKREFFDLDFEPPFRTRFNSCWIRIINYYYYWNKNANESM